MARMLYSTPLLRRTSYQSLRRASRAFHRRHRRCLRWLAPILPLSADQQRSGLYPTGGHRSRYTNTWTCRRRVAPRHNPLFQASRRLLREIVTDGRRHGGSTVSQRILGTLLELRCRCYHLSHVALRHTRRTTRLLRRGFTSVLRCDSMALASTAHARCLFASGRGPLRACGPSSPLLSFCPS